MSEVKSFGLVDRRPNPLRKIRVVELPLLLTVLVRYQLLQVVVIDIHIAAKIL